jgi:hypothetical protein
MTVLNPAENSCSSYLEKLSDGMRTGKTDGTRQSTVQVIALFSRLHRRCIRFARANTSIDTLRVLDGGMRTVICSGNRITHVRFGPPAEQKVVHSDEVKVPAS